MRTAFLRDALTPAAAPLVLVVVLVPLLVVVAEPACAGFDAGLAYHHAPVLFQDTATQGSNVSLDFVTRVDFDGDFVARNNWENQPSYPEPGYVYVDVVETQTHWYLFYSFFHPRDWEQVCLPGLCHENDLENMRVVVEKDGSAYGVVRVVDLQAHGGISSYVPAGSPVTGGSESIDGTLSFEGSHPRIFLEAHGHGPQSCGTDSRCGSFPGGDGVVYRPTGIAEVPAGASDPDVGYALLSGYDELWTRRADYGDDLLWKSEFTYLGSRVGALGRCMGAELTGDNYGGAGVPPWGYDPPGVNRGDWIVDSAYVAASWYGIPGEGGPGFSSYVHNPYLADLQAEGSGTCDGSGGCSVTPGAGARADGALLVLALALLARGRRAGGRQRPSRPALKSSLGGLGPR